MIDLLLYELHIVAALYAYTKRWQEANVREGVLAVLIIGLVFTIGWSITGTVARLVMKGPGIPGIFTSDTLGLILLFIPEAVFFYIFFLKDASAETHDEITPSGIQ
jgi:hypothetical protein